jgi:hypothetical protein
VHSTRRAARAGLALYQESEQLPYYLAFVVGSAVCAGYFLYANFWFLDVSVAGVAVQQARHPPPAVCRLCCWSSNAHRCYCIA